MRLHILYMVGKLAPNSSHLNRGLVKYVSGKGYFRTVPSQNGDKIITFPPPPLIVERVSNLGNAARHVGNHLADAVERKKNNYRGSFPASYSFLPLSLCRLVVKLFRPLPTPSFLSRYVDLW